MASDLEILIGVNLSKLVSGLSEAKSTITEFASAFAGAFAIQETADFVDSTAKLATHIENLSAQLGATSEVVQQMGVMSKAAGGDVDTLANMVNRMEVGMIRGQRATSQQAAAAKALGINIKEFMAAGAEEKILLMADALHKFADSGTKTADVMLLAGRGAAQNINFFNQGRQAILAWNAAMKEQNAIVGEATNTRLAQLDRNIVLMTASWSALGSEIVGKLSPGFTGLITSLGNLASSMTASVREGGILGTALEGISFWLKLVGADIVVFQTAWQEFWTFLKGIISVIGDAFLALGRIIKDVLSFNWSDISAAWNDLQAKIGEKVKAIAADMVSKFRDAESQVQHIMAGVGNAPPGGGPAPGSKPPPAANLGLGEANKNAMKLAEEAYQEQVALQEQLVATFKETEAEKVANLKQALAQRMNAEIAAGENVMVAEKKMAAAVEKLNLEAAKKTTQEWKKAADQFASDFSSAIDEVLTKQKSFSQAMGQMFGKMIEQMIAQLIKLIATWIILNIVSGGGVSFSAVAGSSGGIIGALFSGHAAGTPYIQNTGLAMLHQGEAVIPAEGNPFTGQGGMGAGGNVNLTISALDASGFASWLRGGGGNMLSRYLSQQWQHNPSMRPGFAQ